MQSTVKTMTDFHVDAYRRISALTFQHFLIILIQFVNDCFESKTWFRVTLAMGFFVSKKKYRFLHGFSVKYGFIRILSFLRFEAGFLLSGTICTQSVQNFGKHGFLRKNLATLVYWLEYYVFVNYIVNYIVTTNHSYDFLFYPSIKNGSLGNLWCIENRHRLFPNLGVSEIDWKFFQILAKPEKLTLNYFEFKSHTPEVLRTHFWLFQVAHNSNKMIESRSM